MRNEDLERFETLELVELVYQMVERGTKVPISGKVMIDKKEILDRLDEIINMYPDEVKRAKWIVDNKNNMLKEAEVRLNSAKRESMDIIENQIQTHDIVREANERAEVIKAKANEEARQIRIYAREYANDVLGALEKQIETMTAALLEHMKTDMEEFADKFTSDMKATTDIIKENAKELEAPLV
ncbi:MAG: ATPase [Sarcina sp.]